MEYVQLEEHQARKVVEAIEQAMLQLTRVIESTPSENIFVIEALEKGVEDWAYLKQLIVRQIQELD